MEWIVPKDMAMREDELAKVKRQRDRLREALEEVAMRIEGDLCQTVRDVINGLADANDVYDDAENIERIARAALAEMGVDRDRHTSGAVHAAVSDSDVRSICRDSRQGGIWKMGLSKDQQFTNVIWFLLSNGEDFRIMYDGEEWMSIGDSVYCNGMLVPMFERQTEGGES